MAFDWKIFAANFLGQAAEGLEQNRADAKAYQEKQDALVERNQVLRAKRKSTAKQAAQFGKRAKALGATDAMVQTAMSSGVNEIGAFYQKLEELAQQQNLRPGEKLSTQDIQAGVSMPELAPVDMSMIDFAMQTYGAALPEGAVKAPEGEGSMIGNLFGFGYKDRIKREMAEDTSYGGMSALEISQLASMQDYNEILEGAYVTYQDPKIMGADEGLEFTTGLLDYVGTWVKDNEDEMRSVRSQAAKTAKELDLEGVEFNNFVKAAEQGVKQEAAEPYITTYLELYKGSFFDSRVAVDALRNMMGDEYVAEMRELYSVRDREEEQLPDGQLPMNTKSDLVSEAEAKQSLDDPDSALAPFVKDSSMQKPNTVSDMDERDGITPAAPLDDTGKATIEKALSGKLIFRDDEDKYTDRYTREQWKEMSRNQREERGLPVSALGGTNFYFRDDLEKFLEEPRANLEIIKNSTSPTFKVRIKGRGTFTVTREQLDAIPQGYFTGSSPAIIVSEYEEGEKPAKKITSTVLKRLR